MDSDTCGSDKAASQTWEHLIFDDILLEAERAKLIRKVVREQGRTWSVSMHELVVKFGKEFH